MVKARARRVRDPLGAEYAVVSFRLSWLWGLASIALFLYGLPIYDWVQFWPWHPAQGFRRPGALVLGTLVISALGAVVALPGLRTASRGIARVGLFLNAVAFVIVFLTLAALVAWWVLH